MTSNVGYASKLTCVGYGSNRAEGDNTILLTVLRNKNLERSIPVEKSYKCRYHRIFMPIKTLYKILKIFPNLSKVYKGTLRCRGSNQPRQVEAFHYFNGENEYLKVYGNSIQTMTFQYYIYFPDKQDTAFLYNSVEFTDTLLKELNKKLEIIRTFDLKCLKINGIE